MARSRRFQRGRAVVVAGCDAGGLAIAARLARAGFADLRWYGRWHEPGDDPPGLFRRAAQAEVRAARYDPGGRRWSVALSDGRTADADLLIVAGDSGWLPEAIRAAAHRRPGGPVPPAGSPGPVVAFVGTDTGRELASSVARRLVPDLARLSVYRAGPAVGSRLTSGLPRPRQAPTSTSAVVAPLIAPAAREPIRPGAPPTGPLSGPPSGLLPAQRGAPTPARTAADTGGGGQSGDWALRAEPDRVVTVDGAAHAADVVLAGSTFTAAELLAPIRAGASGQYCGVSVVGVPGLFVLYGPISTRLPGYRRGRITVMPAGLRAAPKPASASGTSSRPISRVTNRSGWSTPDATRPSSSG
jgi:hypothetical protein